MEINIYSYDEAFNASCDYFNGDELAARVWVNKYALKDSYGNIYEKTPDDMHHDWHRNWHGLKVNTRILCRKRIFST